MGRRARRSNGEGSIVRRSSDGLWQASLQINKQRRTVYARSRAEAARKLEALKAQAMGAGRLPDNGKRTVADLLDAWLQTKSPSWRPKTAYDYRNLVDYHIRLPLGDVRLNRVNPERIQHLLVTLQERGHHRQAQRVYRVLSAAFKLAVKWGWVAANPCDRVEPPRYHPPRREVWTVEQTRYFLDQTAHTEFGPLWTVAICSGARLSELLAVTWYDVSFDKNMLSITKSRQRINGQWLTLPPKTRSGHRVISLPGLATQALADRWERRDPTTELIFPYTPERVCEALRAECIRLGLPRQSPHALRHLHASLLLDSGLPVPAVSARLGHATPQVTMTVYAHHIRGQDQTAAVLDRKLGGGP